MSMVMSSGHGLKVRGASGYLDEVNEARRVVDRVAELVPGTKVFHDNTSTSQNQNLQTIVNYHNSQTRDLDVSVHFNAYHTTAGPMGTEVLWVTQEPLAAKVSKAISEAGHLINRGPKKRTDLYFLNKTNKPAVLIEVCFVDSAEDARLYSEHFEAICKAIAQSLTGQEIEEPIPPEPVEPPDTEENRVAIVGKIAGHVNVVLNGVLVYGEEGCPNVADLSISKTGDVIVTINGEEFNNAPGGSGIPENQRDIICTVFGGASDPNDSAYPPYGAITDEVVGVALPWKFQGERPQVRVVNVDGGKDALCDIVDVGPWLIDDNYWETGERPEAETYYLMGEPLTHGPNQGKVPNGAGIDLTVGAAKAVGVEGKGKVNWEFIPAPPGKSVS